jgi:hypothetical protein
LTAENELVIFMTPNLTDLGREGSMSRRTMVG